MWKGCGFFKPSPPGKGDRRRRRWWKRGVGCESGRNYARSKAPLRGMIFSYRSRPERPSSVRASPCQLPRRGSFFCPWGELFLFPADSCPNERDKWALVFLHKKLRNCEVLYVVFTLLTNVLERDTIWAHQTRRSPKWKWQMHSFTAPVRRPARWRFLSFFWPVCGQTFCACCPLLSRTESGRGFIFRMKKRLRSAAAFL